MTRWRAAACGATLTVALVAAECGPGGRDARAARRTLVVAVGADEFPVPRNRERLGRHPLNAGSCESMVRLAVDFAIEPALATR